MAIYKRTNVVELVRASKNPYWRIFENESKKAAGNFVASANFEDKDLTITASCDDLQQKIDRLSPGRYIIVAYERSDKKGAAVDSAIELESLHHGSSAINGTDTNNHSSFFIEGIGLVTPENFESALDKKFDERIHKMKEKERLVALEKENSDLKKDARLRETAINKGLASVGAIAYSQLSKTPAFKDVMGMMGQAMKPAETAVEPSSAQPAVGSLPENHVESDNCEIGGTSVPQDRLFAALDKLGANNPDVLAHLEKLAELKQNDPDMFQAGIDFMDTQN